MGIIFDTRYFPVVPLLCDQPQLSSRVVTQEARELQRYRLPMQEGVISHKRDTKKLTSNIIAYLVRGYAWGIPDPESQ